MSRVLPSNTPAWERPVDPLRQPFRDQSGGGQAGVPYQAGLAALAPGRRHSSADRSLTHFDRVPVEKVETGARHPRGNADWPLVGIFAQRGKNRPNRIGVSRCRLLRTDGLDLHVQGLDAVDGTPVLDIKPYMAEFGPQGPTHQPAWATEIMRDYY